MRRLALLSLVLAACTDPAGPLKEAPLTPSFSVGGARATHLVWSATPGRAVSALAKLGITPNVTWSHAIHGASATLSSADSAALAADGIHVETNGVVRADRATPSWGIDRIDQRNLPLNGSYLPPTEGAGVHAYIIDSGVDIAHPEFGGRASNGFDAIDGSFTLCHDHGTHVAGTVGGATVGVANQVSLVNVRVLGCGGSGTTEQVVAGVDWVTQNAIKPAVANMSLGATLFDPVTCENEALAAAVCNSIASGITYSVSAGNGSSSACNSTPAAVPPALTIAATMSNDVMAGYSNGGPCSDMYAPGSDIYSSVPGGYGWKSGTSMAAPHVAGAAAQVLAANPTFSPAQVAADILGRATPNVIAPSAYVSDTPNLLLFTGTDGSTPPPTPDPSFTVSCAKSSLTCTFTGADGDWYVSTGDTGSGSTFTYTFWAHAEAYVTHTISGFSASVRIRCSPKACRVTN